MVLFSAATFKMSPFDPNTESRRRASETGSNQTSEDTSEEREGFPLSDDTVIRHNSCHTDMVQQFLFPHLLCVFVCAACACVNTHVRLSLCMQVISQGKDRNKPLIQWWKSTLFTWFTSLQGEISINESCIQNLAQVEYFEIKRQKVFIVTSTYSCQIIIVCVYYVLYTCLFGSKK